MAKVNQAAPKPGPKESTSPKKYTVVIPFRDKDDFAKEHKKGADVSHFDAARLNKLLNLGHVEVSSTLYEPGDQ